ncbi:MAG TPA: PIN domain-containing protein [Micromonosporaceae bacterium]|nr:PIN domain-containing protein [Micromonosporaceae bacterium]
MIILDTSGLLAALDQRAKQHIFARQMIEESDSALVLSPFVLAELDYLVSSRLGATAMLPVFRDVVDGVYELAAFGSKDVASAVSVMSRYRDLEIGLTDASLVILAERYSTTRLLTLDERHFRTVTPLSGGAFELLPHDRNG